MSFTSDIKQEIALADLDDCCKKAELCALLELTSSLTISNRKVQLLVRSESATVAKRCISLLKNIYNADTKLTITRKTNLKKNNVYNVDVFVDGRKLLEDLGLYSETKGILSHPSYNIVLKNCCARNYLAGSFLAYGACNSPNNKNYHLEISLESIDHANFLVKLINRFNIEPKVSKRRNKYIVYIKKAENIADFLRIIGANDALYNFEDARISRDIKHSIIRVDNCEIANEMKSLKASSEQVEYMNLIKESGAYKDLDEKLKNVIDIRLAHKEYTMKELCEAYDSKYGEPLSKSGLKHRLNKIESIAMAIKEGEE